MTYDKNTLGYHRAFAVALFGEDSKSVKYLDEKATQSPNGLNEPVIQEESQVVHLLSQIHFS